MSVYAAALWVFGKSEHLAGILDPGKDEYATMLEFIAPIGGDGSWETSLGTFWQSDTSAIHCSLGW